MKRYRKPLACLSLLLILYGGSDAMAGPQDDIHTLIAQLQAQAFSVDRVEQLLGAKLTLELDNGSFLLYVGRGRASADGADIAAIDLRLPKDPLRPGFLVLDIAGRCIRLDELEKRYGELALTGMPRGHSSDEQTSYSVVDAWGRLSFGFREAAPECLATIALDPAGW